MSDHEEESRGAEPSVPDGGPDGSGSETDESPSRARTELPPPARRFLRTGLLLYPVVVVGLWAATDLDLLNAALLTGLMELLPVLAVAQVPLAGEEEVDRPAVYLGSAMAILFLGWVSLSLGEDQVGYEAMGFSPLSWEEFLVWTGVALVGSMGMVGVFHLVEKAWDLEESEVLKQILPRTTREKTLFAGVSLAAGLGEELAYRSYAIPVLATLIGSTWAAAVLSSGIFGFLHAYQGGLGVVRTAVLGFALAAVFVGSGSIWPPIVAHTVIDLIGGLILGPRLLKESGGGKD